VNNKWFVLVIVVVLLVLCYLAFMPRYKQVKFGNDDYIARIIPVTGKVDFFPTSQYYRATISKGYEGDTITYWDHHDHLCRYDILKMSTDSKVVVEVLVRTSLTTGASQQYNPVTRRWQPSIYNEIKKQWEE